MTVIALVGLPGCGKSNLARALAKDLGWKLVDLDDLIESEAGRTISKLFEKGEDHFRDWEHRCLQLAAQGEEVVIATGGGVVERAENRALLKRFTTVFVDVSVEEAQRRTSKFNHRPLLAGNPQALVEMERRRRPLYEDVSQLQVSVDDSSKATNYERLRRVLVDGGVIEVGE